MNALTIHDLNPPDVLEAVFGTRQKRGKYNHRRVLADGHVFDSEAEYRRYCHLRLLQRAGTIDKLAVHPKYEVLPAFKTASGVRHTAIHYSADFSYQQNGLVVVEDVKAGKRTKKTRKITPVASRDFTLRRKLFQNRCPDIRFVLVIWLENQWHEQIF